MALHSGRTKGSQSKNTIFPPSHPIPHLRFPSPGGNSDYLFLIYYIIFLNHLSDHVIPLLKTLPRLPITMAIKSKLLTRPTRSPGTRLSPSPDFLQPHCCLQTLIWPQGFFIPSAWNPFFSLCAAGSFSSFRPQLSHPPPTAAFTGLHVWPPLPACMHAICTTSPCLP